MLRVLFLGGLIVGAITLSRVILHLLDAQLMPVTEQQVHMAIMLGSIIYVALLTLPFVPGVEIGIAMLAVFGADIMPLLYFATVLALLLAYGLGRLVPITVLADCLSFLRMNRAATLVLQTAPLSQADRVAMLTEGRAPKLVALALRHRYVALAIIINIPGNAIIGGGGGIMMLAGISGIFSPLPTALTILIAVTPVPVAMMLFGL